MKTELYVTELYLDIEAPLARQSSCAARLLVNGACSERDALESANCVNSHNIKTHVCF